MDKAIITVHDVMEAEETAVIIFARGKHIKIEDDSGQGHTGYWRIDKTRQFKRIVLYWRDGNKNSVYVTDFEDMFEEGVNGRLKLSFTNAQFCGTTTSNWWQFTNSRTNNPVRYVGE